MAQDFAPSLFSTQITKASYYCPKRSSKPAAWDIVCAGWEECRKDYVITRTTFPWLAVELIVRGEGWVEIQDRRFRLRPGTLFAYGPHISYRMKTDARHPMLKYFIDFTGTQARRIMSRGPLLPGRVLQVIYPQELRDIFDRVIMEGNRKSVFSQEIANNYLQILLRKFHESAPGRSSQSSSRALDSYLQAKALFEKDYLHLSSAEFAAERLGMTPETLCRLFHRFSNTSPYQYLLQLKINQSVDLLLGSGLLVKEVGALSGFDDPFQFSRVFKRLQGISPDLFRKTHKRNST